MKGIETGKDKVKRICDVLRKETLEPAKNEAEEIVRLAKIQAEKMIEAAHQEIEGMHLEAQEEIQRQKNIFQSSLKQACRQAISALKESVEEKIFNQELGKVLSHHTQDTKVLSQLINAVVKAIDEQGMDANLSVYIPAAVPARAVNELLANGILDRLKEKSVLLGPITGGIQVKLHKENITIDISDAALKELLANYIRKDFREMIFSI